MSHALPLRGRTTLVTGANAGLGLAAARQLAHAGAHVVLAARTMERGETAAAHIRESEPAARLSVVAGDFSSLSGVRALAGAVRRACPRLDVLINNAGVVRAHRHETVDGFEWTFAVNHLAPFLLTRLLMPAMGAGGRVVVVTSDAHRDVSLDLDDLHATRAYDPLVAYRRSKLANVLFARTLARRAPELSVFAVAPGIVATDIVREAPSALQEAWATRGRPAREAARTIVHAAADPALAGTTLRYFSEGRELSPSAGACDDALGERLWEISAVLTGTPAWPVSLTE
ncbi:MAG: SDR family NAD(P)-dependent oxidoreductase [Vicinamibacterales bacterium]